MMKIESIGHPQAVPGYARLTRLSSSAIRPYQPPTSSTQPVQTVELPELPDDSIAEPVPVPAPQEPVEPPTESVEPSERAKGVLRLLEAGHFKGVADVRLRINFFEELSARAQAAAGPVVTEQSQTLLTTVQEKANELLAPFLTNEETRATVEGIFADFESALADATQNITAQGAISADSLSDSIQSAFDTLIQALANALRIPAPIPAATDPTSESPTDDPVTDAPTLDPTSDEGPTDAPTVNLDDALVALHQTFEAALATLMSEIQAATTLPDPAPYSGNGRAYDKFLAIYNDLRGVSAALDEQA
jgi:hypothetical protein